MSRQVLQSLQHIRGQTRIATVVFAVAASAAVVMIPLAYRAGMPGGWLVIAPSIIYLTLAAIRLVGGFQADHQLEFEERFVRFAANQGTLLSSAQAAGKLWKVSCVVQGLSRSETGAVPDSERQIHLIKSLRATGTLLAPSFQPLAIPGALLLAMGWMVMAAWLPSSRGLYLYVAVLPVLAVLGWAEVRTLRHRREIHESLEGFYQRVAEWGESEWRGFRDEHTVRPFQHRTFYRDPLLPR